MIVTSESFPLTISIDNNIAVMKVSFDDRHLAKNNGFKWNPDKKCWYMDGRYFALKRGELTENLSLVFPEGCGTEAKESYGKHPLLDSCLASLKMKPYPYQIDGINYALHNNYCVIGDEMGLGKSFQSIAVAKATRGNDKIVVCCPAFLKYNWSREVSKFTDMTSFVVKNKKNLPEALKSKADVLIINYEMLEHAEDIFTISNVWIFDEAHALKNVRAKRTKFFAKYLKKDKPERLMLLSGTPIKNRVTEFYSLLSACSLSPVDCGIRIQDCGEFSTQWKFNQFFSHEVKTRFGTEFKGTKNIEVLRKVMVKKYIRHNVGEHLKELPPLIRNKIAYDDIPAADLKALDAELAEAVKAIGTKAAMSSAIASIKKGAAVLKVPGTVGHVLSLLEAGEPVGVFTDHVDSAEAIAEAIKAAGFSACCITGKTPMDTRDGFVQAFQGGEIEAFVATIGAASTGLTLTRSRHCVFNDLPWVPSDFMQAEKRYHRIGQANTVFVSVLVAPGLDEYIVDMLLEKAAVMSTVLTEGKQKLLDFREV